LSSFNLFKSVDVWLPTSRGFLEDVEKRKKKKKKKKTRNSFSSFLKEEKKKVFCVEFFRDVINRK